METSNSRPDAPVDPLLQRLQQVRGRPIPPMSGEQLMQFRQRAHRQEFARVQRQAIQERLNRLMQGAKQPPLSRCRFSNWNSREFVQGQQLVEQARSLARQMADGQKTGCLLLGDGHSQVQHLAVAMLNAIVHHTSSSWLAMPAQQLVEAITPPCGKSRPRKLYSDAAEAVRMVRRAEVLLLLDVDDNPGGLNPAQQQLLARQLQWRHQQGLATLITSRWPDLAQWHQMADPVLRDMIEHWAPEVMRLKPLSQQLGLRICS